MTNPRISLGRSGEAVARSFLLRRGYAILETNYRCPWGEVDIVASQDGVLVFVEVRARRGRAMGTPEESVTRIKQQHLIATAQHYVQEHCVTSHWRIDLVAVRMDWLGQVLRVSQVTNAVTGDL